MGYSTLDRDAVRCVRYSRFGVTCCLLLRDGRSRKRLVPLCQSVCGFTFPKTVILKKNLHLEQPISKSDISSRNSRLDL